MASVLLPLPPGPIFDKRRDRWRHVFVGFFGGRGGCVFTLALSTLPFFFNTFPDSTLIAVPLAFPRALPTPLPCFPPVAILLPCPSPAIGCNQRPPAGLRRQTTYFGIQQRDHFHRTPYAGPTALRAPSPLLTWPRGGGCAPCCPWAPPTAAVSENSLSKGFLLLFLYSPNFWPCVH